MWVTLNVLVCRANCTSIRCDMIRVIFGTRSCEKRHYMLEPAQQSGSQWETIVHMSFLVERDLSDIIMRNSEASILGMGLSPDTSNRGCACAGHAGNVFPATAGKRSRHASRHVRDARAVMYAGIANWRFSLKSVAGQNVPGIPGGYASRNATYLARGPWVVSCIPQLGAITNPCPRYLPQVQSPYMHRKPTLGYKSGITSRAELAWKHNGSEQNGRHFTVDIHEIIFLNETWFYFARNSLNFVSKCLVNDMSALVQIMV